MTILTFLLSGPLQSWGDSSRWDHRGTADMPSKSAIIGLLGCCFGYKRGDERLRELSQRLHVAVRADQRGSPMWDFQTVQKPGGKILNAMGKPRGETIITPKQYLQDAMFQVFLFGDEEALEECLQAMRHPRWAICLGRKSCPPARPVIPKMLEYDSILEALEDYGDAVSEKYQNRMTCQADRVPGLDIDGQIVTRMDEVIRGDLNEYQEREVYSFSVQRRQRECI